MMNYTTGMGKIDSYGDNDITRNIPILFFSISFSKNGRKLKNTFAFTKIFVQYQ